MTRALLLIAIALVLAGALFWQQRERLPIPPLPPLPAMPKVTGLPALPGAAATPPPIASLRKCVQGSRVLYTDGPCPSGSHEQGVRDDRVTVVPATPVSTPAASAAPGLPNARDVLGRPDDGNLRDKRMQQQIGE